MMLKNHFSRRDSLKLFGSFALSSLLFPDLLSANEERTFHVVIVGGGIGGVSAAKYLRLLNAKVNITIVEPKKEYIFCPGSNEIFSGDTTVEDLTVTYTTIKNRYKINLVHDSATKIDYKNKTLLLKNSDAIKYDKLIVATGPKYDYEAIEGYTLELAKTKYPAAWHVSPQTLLLKKQIEELAKGGKIIISIPKGPYRCPPAPYERATLIAQILKEKNPTAKVIILDSKDSFVFQNEYTYAWREKFNYGKKNATIEWISAKDGGEVKSLDAKNSSVTTVNGTVFGADILNIIPPHKASEFTSDNHLTEGNWCSVEYQDYSSTKYKDVYIIGDTIKSTPMPKTGYIASNQARVVEEAINDVIHSRKIGTPFVVNNCIAMIDKNFGATLSEVYRFDGRGKPLVEQYYAPKLDENAKQELMLSKLANDWQFTFRRSIFS